jgi:hypothetical protein
MPDNGSRRTCSRSGPARLATYVDLRLASRPIAVPRIASRCPPYMSTYGAVGTALLSTCGGAWRSAMWGPSGVASDNRSDSKPVRLGASAEGRLAWPQAPSPSGHACKPTRPLGPHIALRHAPRAPIGRERRGAACVAPGPKPLRPPLQAAPSAEPPRRAPPRPGTTAADKDCNAGQRLATHVLAIGARSAGDLCRFTAGLPPNRCAAHREPLSCVYVYIRRRGDCVVVYVWRGVAECDVGTQRRSE